MDKNQRVQSILNFVKIAEKLKTELRHSWTNDPKRQESVAEHTWMSTMLAILLAPELTIKVDLLKVLKMQIIHDLGEAIIGDIPTFEISDRQSSKKHDEEAAIDKLVAMLPNANLAAEIKVLWLEFEAGKTPEAQFAKSIDKTEVLIQHNISDISTWSQGDFDMALYAKDHLHNFDDFIRAYKDEIDKQTVEKVTAAGKRDRLKSEDITKFEKKLASLSSNHHK